MLVGEIWVLSYSIWNLFFSSEERASTKSSYYHNIIQKLGRGNDWIFCGRTQTLMSERNSALQRERTCYRTKEAAFFNVVNTEGIASSCVP